MHMSNSQSMAVEDLHLYKEKGAPGQGVCMLTIEKDLFYERMRKEVMLTPQETPTKSDGRMLMTPTLRG